MACIIGTESYLHLCNETAWGQSSAGSGSGAAAGTPFFMGVVSYGVRLARLTRKPNTYVGLHQRKGGSKVYGANVAGQIVTPVYSYIPTGQTLAIGRIMMDWAFGDLELEEPRSMSAEWAEGPNVANKRHTGLRINQATLTGSADSGDIQLSLDTIGQQEMDLPAATALPNDMEKLEDMQFTDCTFTIGGTVFKASAFTQTLNRNLQPQRLNDFWITSLCGAARDETIQFVIPKNSDAYDRINRLPTDSEVTGEFTMQGLHNGTGGGGNYTKLTRAFNRLRFLSQEQSGDFGIQMQGLTFEVLKPDSSSASYADTWSEV
jgi:hypothetical protein